VKFDASDIGGLISELERAVKRDVDLVVLDKAPPGLAYRVFRDGRLLVEKDRRARVERQARAVLDYLDFEWVEQRCTRGVLARASDLLHSSAPAISTIWRPFVAH
jgi:polymorphic toxin system nucleotidyltransferase-like protein